MTQKSLLLVFEKNIFLSTERVECRDPKLFYDFLIQGIEGEIGTNLFWNKAFNFIIENIIFEFNFRSLEVKSSVFE